MKKYYELYLSIRKKLIPALGILAVCIIVLPYVILGEGSFIQVHDQMDGEILNYIYQAKYLFNGNMIQEFMNGMPKSSMLPPAPFGVIFYLIDKPFRAYALMHVFILIIGFCGMYTLCLKCAVKEEIAFLGAVFFCYMPFYPVYGLSILGQPMLVVCFMNLMENKKWIRSLLGIILFGGFSSFALVGYAWVGIGMLFCLLLLIKKEAPKAGRVFLGLLTLIGVYLLTNIDLISSMLGGNGFTTHRQEMQLQPNTNLLDVAKNLFLEGSDYAPVYGKVILLLTILILVLASLLWVVENKWEKKIFQTVKPDIKRISILMSLLIVGVILSDLWNSTWIMSVRKNIGGGLAYFQADRISWIFPLLWILVFVFDLKVIAIVVKYTHRKLWKAGIIILTTLLVLGQGFQIARDNTLNKNVRLMLLDDYHQITWKSLYMEEVFDDIKAEITKERGLDTSGFRENSASFSTVSLGLYPSIPLYNGFTCADGYSNNYSLEYKHLFRNIMADELEKNEEARKYFDDWGNRLYLASKEYGFNALLKKGQGYQFTNLAFDVNAMRELNIQYIFSAAPIVDADKLCLSLLSGSPFSSDTSYYEIWVYKLEQTIN